MTSTPTEIFLKAQVLENACCSSRFTTGIYILLGTDLSADIQILGIDPGEYLLGNYHSGLSGLLVTERYLQIISRALRARTLRATAFQAVSRAWPPASAPVL